MALLGAHGVVKTMTLCRLGHPLGGFTIGAHEHRTRPLLRNPVRQQQRTADDLGLRSGHGLLQSGHAMQVGIHADHGIEQTRQKRAHDALADGFAWMERNILAHVGQVRRYQGEVAHAQIAGRTGRQQQFNEFLVRLVQAAQQDGTFGHASSHIDRQRQPQFAVRKSVALHGPQCQTGCHRQALGSTLLVVKIQQAALGRFGRNHVQNSTKTRGTSSAVPM